MGSRVTPHTIDSTITQSTRQFNQPSTAHIASDNALSKSYSNNPNAKFAYDELVLACASFLGSPIIDSTVTHLAENIVAILELPNALDSTEVKRRIEQILPASREYKHHRGMPISDKDCTRLCSLADRVINNAPYTNLNIVDDDVDDIDETEYVNQLRRASTQSDVQYVSKSKPVQREELPKQLPSFVERNSDLEDKEEYDKDITPYDSDPDDEPIRMV